MQADTETQTPIPREQLDSNNLLGDIKKIDVKNLFVGERHSKFLGVMVLNSDVTFKATVKGKNKKYFLRDKKYSKNFSSAQILSSKIARAISKKHFASEKWVSDGRIVSESVPEGAIPHPDVILREILETGSSSFIKEEETKEKNPKILETVYNKLGAQSYIKGLGVINEVCAFIGETDHNPENLMYSDKNFDDDSYAIKIDFDRCYLNRPYSFYSDERRVYGEERHQDYLYYRIERAVTRLKLSLISDAMIDALLETYCPASERAKNKTLLIKNRDKARELLESEKYGLPVLFDNKINIEKLIEDFTHELHCYSQKHFGISHFALKPVDIKEDCLNNLKIFLGMIAQENDKNDYKIEAVKKHSGLKELKNKPALSLKDFFKVCATKKWSNNFFGYCWRDSEIEKLYSLGRKCQLDSSEINYKKLSTYLKFLNDKMSGTQVLSHYFSLK